MQASTHSTLSVICASTSRWKETLWALIVLLRVTTPEGAAESLTSPYFNLAEGRIGSSSDTELSEKSYNIYNKGQVSLMVSFNKSRDGYVGWERISVIDELRVNLKFKTKEKTGLIFFLSDESQDNSLSISLVDGKIKVISQKTELEFKETYDDGEWHEVSLLHNKAHLRTDFGGYTHLVIDPAPPPLTTIYANMFIGGLPRRITPRPSTVGTNKPFHGCIADLTVNGKVQNFANTTERSMEIMDRCILDAGYQALDQSIHTLPTVTSLPDTQWTEIDANGFNTEASVTERCALPLQPVQEDLKSLGYRFGTKPDSRVEYASARGRYLKAFEIGLDFKTNEQSADGILFYISDAKRHQQWATLYLQNGYLIFAFKGDGDPLVIKSQATYNDDKWHYIEFSKDKDNGKLVIDDGALQGKAKYAVKLNLSLPLYLGGVPQEDLAVVQGNLNITSSFSGCIKNFFMNSKPMESPKEFGVIPCSDNVEHGTFFGGGENTYIRLKERHKIGEWLNIKMDVKPQVNSGVLIAVHGKKDYFVLEMVNGALKLTVENGNGPMTATFVPPDNSTFSLCDGNWHEILAIKSNSIVSLAVNGVYADPKIGSQADTSTDTGSALFLGGHRYLKRVRGITSRAPFVGCIKNVEMNTEPIELVASMAEGNVTVGTCWTN